MRKNTYQLLSEELGVSPKVLDRIEQAESDIRGEFDSLDDIMAYNQYKVLDSFQRARLSDMHFGWNTGYGYDDPGRDAIEKVIRRYFFCRIRRS